MAWRGSGRSWKKTAWGVVTDVGIMFAVGITSAEVGLSLAEVSASGQC